MIDLQLLSVHPYNSLVGWGAFACGVKLADLPCLCSTFRSKKTTCSISFLLTWWAISSGSWGNSVAGREQRQSSYLGPQVSVEERDMCRGSLCPASPQDHSQVLFCSRCCMVAQRPATGNATPRLASPGPNLAPKTPPLTLARHREWWGPSCVVLGRLIGVRGMTR